jgi:osmotically-inducible protein OsmY
VAELAPAAAEAAAGHVRLLRVLHGTNRVRADRVFLSTVLAVALGAGAAGCAAYRTYQKCGYAGCPGDAQISADVRAALTQHAALGPPNQIYVHTLNRVVYLSGQVATDLQRATADSIARATPGAANVVDIIGLEYNGR